MFLRNTEVITGPDFLGTLSDYATTAIATSRDHLALKPQEPKDIYELPISADTHDFATHAQLSSSMRIDFPESRVSNGAPGLVWEETKIREKVCRITEALSGKIFSIESSDGETLMSDVWPDDLEQETTPTLQFKGKFQGQLWGYPFVHSVCLGKNYYGGPLAYFWGRHYFIKLLDSHGNPRVNMTIN